MTPWTTLVAPEALAARLGDPALRVFDCRFALMDTSAGERDWRAGHVPGAYYAHLDRDLSGPHSPGAGRHPWPAADAFAQWASAHGIAPGVQVVAYDAADGAFAARLWALLRMAGHEDVAVLDGGLAAWAAAGLPVDAETLPLPLPSVFIPGTGAARLRDAQAVQSHLADGGVLLDARAPERFRGEVEPIDRVAGHVPGARDRPYALNLRDGRFKPAAELADEFAALAPTPDAVVVMCGSGVTACHHLVAMAHAGLPGAALYTGSWSGWVEDPARPVATGG